MTGLGTWFNALSSGAVIDDTFSVSVDNSIQQINFLSSDGVYKVEFETDLPPASALSGTWTAGAYIALSNVTTVRGIRLSDRSSGLNTTVAHLLTGVENINGIVIVNPDGFSTIHMRVPNPAFDPNIEPCNTGSADSEPSLIPGNTEFINVPTNTIWDSLDTFQDFTFEVNSGLNLTVRRDGDIISSGLTAGSAIVDTMSFDSGNQQAGAFETINVDDVSLSGTGPIISPGPAFTLTYSDGFSTYPVNTPIDGQGDVPPMPMTPRYQGGLGGEVLVKVDPTGAAGFGIVLCATNTTGQETGGALYTSMRSTYPDAFAISGTDAVLEFDCFVTDYNSRYTVQIDGPYGMITEIQLGGPDNDPINSQGGVANPPNNFSILETNPGGPPARWFYDTGTLVPIGSWFRLRVTVADGGAYTIEMDNSGVPGGSGAFGIPISTAGAGSTMSGMPLDPGADVIDGFDTNAGLDHGGAGVFLRDPLGIRQDTTLPSIGTIRDDYCFYVIDDIDGAMLGTPPPPCNGALVLGEVIGILRDSDLPCWPCDGDINVCPESQEFAWSPEVGPGTCDGKWRFVDTSDPATSSLYPLSLLDVNTWATYSTIPCYNNPGQPSQWYFDNITLNGDPIGP